MRVKMRIFVTHLQRLSRPSLCPRTLHFCRLQGGLVQVSTTPENIVLVPRAAFLNSHLVKQPWDCALTTPQYNYWGYYRWIWSTPGEMHLRLVNGEVNTDKGCVTTPSQDAQQPPLCAPTSQSPPRRPQNSRVHHHCPSCVKDAARRRHATESHSLPRHRATPGRVVVTWNARGQSASGLFTGVKRRALIGRCKPGHFLLASCFRGVASPLDSWPRRRHGSFRRTQARRPLRYAWYCSRRPLRYSPSCPRGSSGQPVLHTGPSGTPLTAHWDLQSLRYTRFFFFLMFILGYGLVTCISVSKENIGRRSKWGERTQNQVPILA